VAKRKTADRDAGLALVAAAVRDRREALGLSIADAARLAGLAWPTWQRLELGQAAPRRDTVRLAARVLQWPSDFPQRILREERLEALSLTPVAIDPLKFVMHKLIDRLDRPTLVRWLALLDSDETELAQFLSLEDAGGIGDGQR